MRKVLHSFNPNTYVGLRNYTIVRLFLDTGMMLGGLSQLQVNEVNLEDGFVMVHGNGEMPVEVYEEKSCDWRFPDLVIVSYRKRKTAEFPGYSVGVQAVR